MKMQSGFSLLEVLIATAISALLSLILYNAFSQTNRLVQRVRSLMEDTSDTLSSYAQLEKDFSAIFKPVFEEIKKVTPPPAQPPAAGQTQTPPNSPPAAKKEETKQKKPDIIPFKTTKEGDKLASISFVTTNAFSILNEATPRPVRVTYKFKPQEGEQKKLYMLVREEAPYDQKAESEKQSSPAKPAHAYALVRNIKTFSAKFSAYDCQEDSKELVSLSEWGTDEQKKKCPKHTIPQFVEITWDVVDLMTERENSYTVAVAIPAASCPELIEPESTQLPQQPAAAQQPQQQPNSPQPVGQGGQPKQNSRDFRSIFVKGGGK